MLTDVLVSSTWRTGRLPIDALRARDQAIAPSSDEQLPPFRAAAGRHTVVLSQHKSSYVVRVISKGLLFGPSVIVYEETHPNQRYACLDVMARVIRATGDESLGLRAGREAVAWVTAQPAQAVLVEA